jgi:hypothetical protein
MWALGYGEAGESSWHELILRQGQQSTSYAWKHAAAGSGDVPGDVRKVRSVMVTLIAHGKGRPGNFHLDALQITPAKATPAPPGSFDPRQPAVEQTRGGSRVWVTFQPLQDLQSGWRLRPGTLEEGEKGRWFAGDFDDADWPEAQLGFWSPDHDPSAWYRVRFRPGAAVAAALPEKRVHLVFGGVDESAWVYLNGKLLGTHSEESESGWNLPFAFDVSKRLAEGENVLAVRVLNRTHAGGIWRPVLLAAESSAEVLGPAPVEKVERPWEDPEVQKAEAARLQEYVARRRPITPPLPGRHVAPQPLERPREVLYRTEQLDPLALAGGRVTLDVPLKGATSAAVLLDFDDAAFGGAQVLCRINGREMLPYLAFGEDTRYAEARKNPNLSPPMADLRAVWVVPPAWAEDSLHLELENAGPGWLRPSALTVSRAEGDNVPRYRNPIVASLDLWFWQGGYELSAEEEKWNQLLLGLIPGREALANHHGSPEDLKVGYGYGRVKFYTIWYYFYHRQTHHDLLDLDNDPGTPPQEVRTREGMRDRIREWLAGEMFHPGVYLSWDYLDALVLYLEQGVPDWALDYRFGKQGYTPRVWAEAWVQSDEQVKSLLNEVAPWVRLNAEFNFVPSVRDWIYRAPPQQLGHRGCDFIDAIDDHCFGFHFPEVAMEMNRFRLGRTEEDLIVPKPERPEGSKEVYLIGKDGGVVLAKPEELASQGAGASPLDYRAGFDGDEEMADSETVGWGSGTTTYLQGDSTAYRFLYGLVTYTLLPTGAGEPREPQGVALHGQWEDGPAHTKRLRTRDPLFGDLFGFTRWEYCASGDIGGMRGPMSRWARRPPHDALSVLRRAGVGFQSDGPVFPARLHDPDSRHLLVKAFTGVFDWQPFLQLGAVNHDDQAHTLDVSLYLGHNEPVKLLVFDDRAAVRRDGREEVAAPLDGELRYRTLVPARSAWQVFIFDHPRKAAAWTGAPDTPELSAPERGADLPPPLAKGGPGGVTLQWQPSPSAERYVVQIGREALFAEKHLLHEATVETCELVVPAALLKPQSRLWWRVRVVGPGSSAWSLPRPFTIAWPERAAALRQWRTEVEQQNAAGRARLEAIYAEEERWGLRNPDNPVARALRASSSSQHTPSGAALDFDYRTYLLLNVPGSLTIDWPAAVTLQGVRLYWLDQWFRDGKLTGPGHGKDFRFLRWEEDSWKEVLKVTGNTDLQSYHPFPQPVATSRLMLEIETGPTESVGIRELRVE